MFAAEGKGISAPCCPPAGRARRARPDVALEFLIEVPNMAKRYSLGLGITVVLVCAAAAAGETYYRTPADDWYGLISGSGLAPGDEVVLGGGVYSTFSWLPMGHQGTAEEPIVIRAADGASVVITKSNANQNNIDIMGARHLILRGLEITGGSTAIRIQKNGDGDHAKFVTIENCHIHHTGENAITCNHVDQTYEGMIFRRNEIDHTSGHGEGFYLGSNYNASQFYNGLIQGNYIHDLIPNTDYFQGDGIEIKDGSYNNIVRDNVLINTNYPGVIVYGTNGHDRNVVERNVIINCGDNGIQAAADAIVRNNIVYNSASDGIHSHHHQGGIPGNLTIAHNTVIQPYGGDTVAISSDVPTSGPIEVVNNAVYNGGGGGISLYVPAIVSGNVVSGSLAADFGDVANWDFFPVPGSAVIAAGDAAYAVADDFNGTPRDGSLDAGAYVCDGAGNPGWAIQSGFKPPYPGDATDDGLVDGGDYTVWADNYGDTDAAAWSDGGWEVGNFNDDAFVDGGDYTIWADAYGYPAGAAAGGASVPAPGMLALLAVGVGGLLRRRRP